MLLVISSVFSSPVKAETNGNIVYITYTGTKYHRATCPTLSKSKIEITLDKAVAGGYEPCKVCKPLTTTSTFKDVPTGHVFYSSVMDLVARDITQGYGNGYFGENDPITRAQIAVMLVRARPDLNPKGMKSDFKDVPAGYWAEGEIAVAKKEGILDGYGDGRFGPDDHVTRGQFSKYLSNVLKHVDETAEPESEYVENKTTTLNFEFGMRTGRYTGELVNGLPHGYGTFHAINPEGMSWIYQGEWYKGHMEGEGTTTWEDGSQVFSGLYQRDYLIQGTITFSDGRVEQGEFENNRLIQGEIFYASGMRYKGSLVDDLYHGNGTLYDYHGEVIYSGRFNNDYIAESASEYAARKNNIKAKSKLCSVYDLKELCEANQHEYCKVWGQVINVEQYDGYAWIQIDDQGIDSRDRVISIEYRLSEGEILPELWDYIDVWGTTQYMYSYEAIGGFDMNTPLLYGLVIETW